MVKLENQNRTEDFLLFLVSEGAGVWLADRLLPAMSGAGSALGPKPCGGAGSAGKRKETTEGGSAKQQKLEALSGQGGDIAGKTLEASPGQGGGSAHAQKTMRPLAKLSKEEQQEQKDFAQGARAYVIKCKEFAKETMYGEGGEEGDDLDDGMMDGLDHRALGNTIIEWHKNIPAPRNRGDVIVASLKSQSKKVLKELCVWLFEMACLSELPGIG